MHLDPDEKWTLILDRVHTVAIECAQADTQAGEPMISTDTLVKFDELTVEIGEPSENWIHDFLDCYNNVRGVS